MINHHFGGKEALYRACLAGFGEARLRALERFLAPPATKEELVLRLELLVNELLDMHLEEPDVVAILLRDVNAAEAWGEDLSRLLYEFQARYGQFFQQAKEHGYLRQEVDPQVAASIIYLSLTALVQLDERRERITGVGLSDVTNRRALVKQLIDIVLRGVLR